MTTRDRFAVARAFADAIRARLGFGPRDDIEPGKLHRFPTSDRRTDSAGWCRLFPDLRAGAFGDWRTGLSEVWTVDTGPLTPAERRALDAEVRATRARLDAETARTQARNLQRVAALWEASRAIGPGDAAALYLRRRGVSGFEIPAALRAVDALDYWHPDDTGELRRLGTYPAMLALLVGPDGAPRSVHRTWLTRDGRKADVPTSRKVTAAAGPLAGAAIRLRPLTGDTLGVAEGIETALAAGLLSGVPCWSTYSAHGIASFVWPVQVRALVVFADHDQAGIEAAQQLRQRAMRAGLRCEVCTPSVPKVDWADVLLAYREAERGAA